MKMRSLLPFFCFTLLFILPLVSSECTCTVEETGTGNRNEALKYKIAAIIVVLLAGASGVCFPIIGKFVPWMKPETNLFLIVKAFAAGVILSTGFIHVLPDSFESLTSPCLGKPWSEFPFAGFIAMLSAIVTLMVETAATSYYNKVHFKNDGHESNQIVDAVKDLEHEGHVPVHSHATHGHSHISVAGPISDESQLLKHRVVAQVLEIGILVHSVIIGVSLGASVSLEVIKPLFAALVFHQFFEGLGLGGCISQAKFKCNTITLMALFFSLTTPVGIGIGIGISRYYSAETTNALIVEGVFNAASAGILIYMALVDLLAPDFQSAKMQSNGKLRIMANIALLLGTGLMSGLANWA